MNIARRLPATTDPCGRVTYSRSRPQDDGQYIGKMDVQLNQNHSLFGRYIFTADKLTPPLELQPENLLVSSLGGRDNKAHSFTAGDTMVLSNSMVNAFRVAYNYTDIHRTHAPLGFDTTDLGISTYSYLEDYMLVAVNNGGFSMGGGTESEARFKTPSINFTDDLTLIRGRPPVRLRRQRVVLEVALAGQRAVAGTVHLHGHEHRPAAGRLPERQPELADSGHAELARHAAAVSGPLRAGYVEVLAQGHVELRPAVGAGPAAADPERRHLQLQRRSLPERRAHHPYTNAPPGFLYPGDAGFVNDKAGIKDRWLQFSPRVGFAWDPAGDGRMSVRTGYSLAYDFVNAQFHLNTSVAPPFNAEARVTNPVGASTTRGWERATSRSSRSPRAELAVPPTGPYISISPDLDPPRQQSWNVSFQRQIGDNLAASATYLGTYSDRLWNVRSLNPSVYIPGSCTLQTNTGPQFFANCSSTAAGAAATWTCAAC